MQDQNDRTTELTSSLPDAEVSDEIAHEAGIDPVNIQRVVELVKAGYSGPIPPTSEVIKLNAIAPGLGTRLVEDHLLQRQHERDCDLRTLELSNDDAKRKEGWLRYAGRGQAYGATSLFAFLLAAVGALLLDHPAVAIAFVSPAIVGAISKSLQLQAEGDEAKIDQKD
jgi:hypothetical protein